MSSFRHWLERNPRKIFLAIFLVTLILIIAAAEKILAYKNQGIRNNYALPTRAITLREHHPFFSDYFVYDPKTMIKDFEGMEFKKYLMRIDENGFIMPSKRHAHPDLSLFFLGGSVVECQYVEEENRFPYLSGYLLEQKLGIKINSYNSARSGNNSLHSIDILLNKIIPLNPNYVLMLHNVNDLIILMYEKTYWVNNPYKSVIYNTNKNLISNGLRYWRDRYIPNVAMAWRQMQTAVKVRISALRKGKPASPEGDEFAHVRGKKVTFDKAQMLEQFEANLQTFIGICQARKITPVLLTMASRLKEQPDDIILKALFSRYKWIEYPAFKEMFDAFNDAIRKKAQENKVMLIDLAREIPPERTFMVDTVHFNDQGSRRAAEIIRDKLAPAIKPGI